MFTIAILLSITYTAPAFTYRDIYAKSLREKGEPINSSVDLPSSGVELPNSLPSIYWSRSNARNAILSSRYRCLVLHATGGDKEGGSGKKGYRFGDITKSLIGGSVEKVRDGIVLRLL